MTIEVCTIFKSSRELGEIVKNLKEESDIIPYLYIKGNEGVWFDVNILLSLYVLTYLFSYKVVLIALTSQKRVVNIIIYKHS